MTDPFAGPIGLIVNVHSRRNRERLERVRTAYRDVDRLLAHEIRDVEAIPGILDEFVREGISLLAISGGDGTVQAAMTSLIRHYASNDRPPIAVLAGGMTNVTGHHVGIAGKPDRGLKALLERRRSGRPLRRIRHPVMKVRKSSTAEPHYGMLMGGAAFFDGTMMARRRVHPVGIAQSAAAGVAGFAYYVRTLFGQVGNGHAMRISMDGNGGPEGQCYLFLLSCLPGLLLHLDPFWGDGEAPLRWTWVDHPPRRMALAAAPLLMGRPTDWMKRAGYRSGRAYRIEIESDTPLLFDGERIDAKRGEPVVVESGEELLFARL